MNVLHTIALLAAAYGAVFLATEVNVLRSLLGAQFDLLPALMVYCGLSANLATLTAVAVFGGFLFDSLSANPLGITFVPLFLVGFFVHFNRELILRDEAYAQFVLGTGGSIATPILSVLLLLGGGHKPLIGWGSIWQVAVMAVIGGCCTPLCFRLFDRIHRTFAYQPVPETSFRPDREIKRGRA